MYSMNREINFIQNNNGFCGIGARTLIAESSTTLEKAFRQAVGARHTAATRMNDRSSRSHLIIGLVIESRSRVNGTLLRGKVFTFVH